jgi:basic amino acid/polyamine antiporter, APA family
MQPYVFSSFLRKQEPIDNNNLNPNSDRSMNPKSQGSFQKRLTLFDATALVVGSMIGSGIFIVSADIARTVGAPGWLLVIWAATGVLTVTAALCYGELACLFPHAGGQYVFLREAYNPLVAFLYGWAAFLVIQCGTIAAVAMGFAKFTGVLFPWISESRVWFHWGFLRFTTVHVVAIASVLFLTWFNTRGIVAGKRLQNVFTSSKFVILAGFIAAGLLAAKNPEAVRLNAGVFWDGLKSNGNLLAPLSGFALLAALGTAMVGSLFSADAWNNVTFASDEVIKPKRDVPLSLFLGTLIVCVMYMLVNIVYLQALPLRGGALNGGASVFERGIQFATDDRVATAAMQGLLGSNAAVFMAVLIMISTFGCNNGIILASARLYYAMAKDGLFFKSVGTLNSRGVPAKGLVVQGIWTSLLCLSGKYGNLLDYVVFTVLLFYILTIVSIFLLRRKHPDLPRPYKAVGYPVIPALYVLIILFIMIVLLAYKPMYTWPGLIIVLLGIPVFFIWKHFNRRTAGEKQ